MSAYTIMCIRVGLITKSKMTFIRDQFELCWVKDIIVETQILIKQNYAKYALLWCPTDDFALSSWVGHFIV